MAWMPRHFLTLLIASMACWLERQSALQIEYLKAENRALRSRLGPGRILFTDAERRTLGTLARQIGTKALRGLDPLVSQRDLVALAQGIGGTDMDISGATSAREISYPY
jgi:hypothetical protein